MLIRLGAAERVGSSFTGNDERTTKVEHFRLIDGGVVLADDTLFPGVIGTGSSMLMGFLGVSLQNSCTP
jgi:hypothetical protein